MLDILFAEVQATVNMAADEVSMAPPSDTIMANAAGKSKFAVADNILFTGMYLTTNRGVLIGSTPVQPIIEAYQGAGVVAIPELGIMFGFNQEVAISQWWPWGPFDATAIMQLRLKTTTQGSVSMVNSDFLKLEDGTLLLAQLAVKIEHTLALTV